MDVDRPGPLGLTTMRTLFTCAFSQELRWKQRSHIIQQLGDRTRFAYPGKLHIPALYAKCVMPAKGSKIFAALFNYMIAAFTGKEYRLC